MSNLTTSQKRKALETRRVKVTSKINELKKELHSTEQQLHNHKKTISNIDKQLSGLSLTPDVSEHALIRYMERHYNINFEEIKKEILTDILTAQIDSLISGKFSIHAGLTAVVKNKTVITITK